MIATILKSTPTFNAVLYNEHKVSQGKATLLELKNFEEIDKIGYTKPEQLQQYLIEYSSRNQRIKNPQFHLAISCKGNEWTEQQLLDFAHDYLEEMGYGDPEQPLLVYAHRDTDNTHIHIVTSRVDPKGKKINDSKERIRSQKVIDKLLGKSAKEKAEKDVREAFTYGFTDMNQFKAVLSALGYESYETKGDDQLCVKKGGAVQMKIPKEEIRKAMERNRLRQQPDPDERMRWKQILKKYRDQNSSRQGLEKDMRSLFGVSLVWLGKKDDPFGYVLVDFNKKKVYDGYKILHIKQLTDFMTKEEHISQIQVLIDQCLVDNPYITTKELNSKLRKVGGFVRKDCFRYGNESIPLDRNIRLTLDRNNKIAWRQSFHPASEAERDFICRVSNFGYPHLVKVEPQTGAYKPREVAELYDILSGKDTAGKISSLNEAGYRIHKTDEGVFAVNFDKNIVVDMSRTGFPESMYSDLTNTPSKDRTQSAVRQNQVGSAHSRGSRRHSGNLLGKATGSSSQNREWEVGKKDYDRDDPDRNPGIGY